MVCIDNYGNLVTYDDGFSTYELYHHGILGQKWGRQNGPPYPIDAGDHSASEKRAGWKKSLASVAKATGKGVAAAAKGTYKATKAVAKGTVTAAKATKKGLIRLNLYPKKLMTNQDIIERLDRLDMENALRRAKGKMTAEDKLNMKLKRKDAMRDVVKNSLSQLIPAIGKDLIIKSIMDKKGAELEVWKKEKQSEFDIAKATAKANADADADIRKESNKTALEIAKKRREYELEDQKDRAKNLIDLDNKAMTKIYEDAISTENGGPGLSPAQARRLAANLSDDYGKFRQQRLDAEKENARREANARKAEKARQTRAENERKAAEAQRRLDAERQKAAKRQEADATRESFNQWANKRQKDLRIKFKYETMKAIGKQGGTVLNVSGGKVTYKWKPDGRTYTVNYEEAANDVFEYERKQRMRRDSESAFGG